jgi:hypothetical protein
MVILHQASSELQCSADPRRLLELVVIRHNNRVGERRRRCRAHYRGRGSACIVDTIRYGVRTVGSYIIYEYAL